MKYLTNEGNPSLDELSVEFMAWIEEGIQKCYGGKKRMGSSYKFEQEIQCPYFVIAKSTKGGMGFGITCEGIDSAQYNTTRFETDANRLAYIEKYCKHFPNNCQIAKAIDEKYAGG